MRQSVYVIVLIIALLILTGTASAQRYTDWTGFEFKVGKLDNDDHVEFYEVQKDYTISLPEYFLNAEELPDCCESERQFYHDWAASLPPCDWEFITLEIGGYLTIKRGYRWDGASYPCKGLPGDLYCPDEQHNYRSSCVHDALYDLMRMNYLPPDRIGSTAGDHDRKMTDMIHYMIALEDGDCKDCDKGAEYDYEKLQDWGQAASHDLEKLAPWKYHFSELTAYTSGGMVLLEWKAANEAERCPDSSWLERSQTALIQLERDGELLMTLPFTATSFGDISAPAGAVLRYSFLPPDTVIIVDPGSYPSQYPLADNYPNEEYVIPVDGAGNALVLDGIDDYMEADNTSNDLRFQLFTAMEPPALTMEAWVYPESVGGRPAILAFNTIDADNYNLLLYDADSLRFCYYDNDNGAVHSADQFAVSEWYHVAVTIDPFGDGVLLVNGTEQALFTTDIRPERGARFSVGQEWDIDGPTQFFEGMIDEVRIWSVARTQVEIQDAMYDPLPGNEEDLVGLWHFDEPNDLLTPAGYPTPVNVRKGFDATSNSNDGVLHGYGAPDTAFVPSGAMSPVTDVDDDPLIANDHLPTAFALHQNYPNPFNPETQIEFVLPQSSHVKLEIFNVLGERVCVLLDRELPAGLNSVSWDGCDGAGDEVSSGIYLYRVETELEVGSRKMLLLR